MTVRLGLIFAAVVLAPTSASAQDPSAVPAPEMKAFIESCSAHKFETIVEATVDGKSRRSKVKLCGKDGQSDADWVRTLEDAVKKIAANPDMPAAVKAQITTALDAEIAKIDASGTPSSELFGEPAATSPPPSALPEYSTLPPLPTGPVSRPAPAPLPEYSALPPLPSVPASPAARRASAQQALARPRLTITCINSGEIGHPMPCSELERETLLTVRADEALTGGTSLRFLRRGEPRGDIALSAMRSGQSARFALPRSLCSGVAGSRVEIHIVRSAAGLAEQVVGTEGPYLLRC